MNVIDFNAKGKELIHTWENVISAGRAREGLRADFQQQLVMLLKECHFSYIRFHGLLSEDMGIYREVDGEPYYNFQYVDKLFDFLLGVGIRPLIEFGFMPNDLASGSTTIFWWKGNVTPPKDYDRWGELVEKCVRHWIFRYGIEEVRRWYFEIWNEPNLSCFWDGTRSEYFKLYETSVKRIKAIDSKLRVGGPATSNFVPDDRFDGETEDVLAQETFKVEDINSLEWHGVWIKEFLVFCQEHNLPVDFVSTHPYPTDFALDGHGISSGKTRKKDSVIEDISWIGRAVDDSSYKDAEIHLTEWSSSPTSRDYSHDFLPAAAYVMRSHLKCRDMVNSLSYWTFTDIFEEEGPGPAPFHGGFGLINLQGIKKPTFRAYAMLNKLGTEVLSEGEGFCITKEKNNISAVFYNYPQDYVDTIPMSSYPDYSVALKCQEYVSYKEISKVIEGLKPGEHYVLDTLRSRDIAVTRWIEMGAPNELTEAQERELIAVGDAFDQKIYTVNSEGKLFIDIKMQSWEIACLYPMRDDDKLAEEAFKEAQKKTIMKLSKVADRNKDKIPYTTGADGKYDDKADSGIDFDVDDGINWWTNGFWGGLMLLMHDITKEKKYMEIARNTEKKLNSILEDFYGINHDLGFLFIPTAVKNYKYTKDPASRKRALVAANLLAARFNPNGNFIRAWNEPSEGTSGKAIIDCMMNLALLYWTSKETGDPRFRNIANKHADTVLTNFYREDGSVSHIVEFDPETGVYIKSHAGQGYSEDSAWSRGQGWAIYGFCVSYKYTHELKYLDAAKKTADYVLEHIPEDRIIPIDFMQPHEPKLEDSCAATVIASGLLELYFLVGDKGLKYRNVAEEIVMTLTEKRADFSDNNDSIIKKCSSMYHTNQHHITMVYADYFYLESLMKLNNISVDMW